MWGVGTDPVNADEAIAFFLKKNSISKEEWLELDSAAQDKAFTVAGTANLDVINDVWSALDSALTEGADLEEFKALVSDRLMAAWGGSVPAPAWRIENIFRTNLQKAYSHGRYVQATDPEVLEDRPYWMFDAIMDSRTSDICADCQGTIRPADDSWWSTHLPPLHFSCRSQMITLTEDQAIEMGAATPRPTTKKADEGFGETPDVDHDWEPSADDYPPELWNIYQSIAG